MNISSENLEIEREIQENINTCVDNFKSFYFDAGAGAGKTYALQKTIEYILDNNNLKTKNKSVLCITYTNAAKDELLERLGKNSEVVISTIHDFLWNFISSQKKLLLEEHMKKIDNEIKIIDENLRKVEFYCNISDKDEFQSKVLEKEFLETFHRIYSQNAAEFRKRILNTNKLNNGEVYLKNVAKFKNVVSDLEKRRKLIIAKNKRNSKVEYIPTYNRDVLDRFIISHNTLLEYVHNIVTKESILKRFFSDKYPYVLIDEYQDTDEKVISVLSSILDYTTGKKKFLVGYFGDELQNIYETGIGNLPNKDKLIQIKKQFNRRSTKQIIDVIEKIRNDNFGQTSIFDNFDNGNYLFYNASNSFELSSFLNNQGLEKETACLMMKNASIAEERGFNLLLENLRCFSNFNGPNFNNINNQFLQKNLQHMGWFLREVLSLIDFIRKLDNNDSTVKVVTKFIGNIHLISFGQFREFVENVRNIEKNDMSLGEYIKKLISIDAEISGKNIISNLFSIEISDDENIFSLLKNSACRYLGDSEVGIDSFFDIDLCQFINWYDYIYDSTTKEGVNYYTLHGSKGLEFNNVVVILQDNFAGKKDYCHFFFENYDSDLSGNDVNRFNAIRNLLYVACSRAKYNLYVVYVSENISDVKENIRKIFGEIEYI